MAYTSTIKGNWRMDTADSLGEVISHLTETKSSWKPEHLIAGSNQPMDRGYNETKDFAHAVELARDGWREGREKMITGLDASRLIQPQARARIEALDVAGAYPIVPAFVAGAPDCMVHCGLDQSAGTQIIRLVVNISYVASVYAPTVTNRGVALLSWVDRLESEGARVEIIALRSTEATRNISGPVRYSCMFPLKRADEPLEVDRAAFVLAHPDMLRRIMFAAMERHTDVEDNFHSSYGKSSNFEPDGWKVPHSVYFNALRDGSVENSNYASITKAVETVEAIIHAGLTQEEAQGGIAA